MKIGVLILAHSNPEQLKKLISALTPDFEVFVHIDKKTSIPVDFVQHPKAHIIKKYKIFWGDYSITRATIDLFDMAYRQDCDYFLLISGSDLPIKTNREIIAEIEEDPLKNYVEYATLPWSAFNLEGGLDRLRLFWETPRGANLYYRIKGKAFSIFRALQVKFNLRRKLLPITYYGGSEWLNLSREATGYIRDYIARNPDYIRKFQYTKISDEIFFHTILMNSPFAPKTVNDNKRLIIWEGRQSPKVLTIADLDTITASKAFFGRKFDETVDEVVVGKMLLRTASKKL